MTALLERVISAAAIHQGGSVDVLGHHVEHCRRRDGGDRRGHPGQVNPR